MGDTWAPLSHLQPPAAQAPYRQQLFEFETFVADGHGWMLVDPAADVPDGHRNRQRIADLLASEPARPLSANLDPYGLPRQTI